MKEIEMLHGHVTTVDDEDYTRMSSFKWHCMETCGIRYAIRMVGGHKKQRPVFIHHAIIGMKRGFEVDHIDGDGLNNQKSNLRFVSHRQNCQNRHQKKTSVYPGVTKRKEMNRFRKPWVATGTLHGSRKHLGYFATEIEAFVAYKDFVKVNFNEEVLL